jgi:hypothetical protein
LRKSARAGLASHAFEKCVHGCFVGCFKLQQDADQEICSLTEDQVSETTAIKGPSQMHRERQTPCNETYSLEGPKGRAASSKTSGVHVC